MAEHTNTLIFKDLGTADYVAIWEAMKDFTIARDAGCQDECWFLQHPPVFTLGQAGREEHVLDAHDIPLVKTDRGGQVTYHGPGQLVAYLLLDIRRRSMGIRELVDLIENSLVALLATYDIQAHTRRDAPGVYVGEDKIAALGLRINNGRSYHGFSLNVDMDLTPFDYINPCGYAGLRATQIRDLVPGASDKLLEETRQRLQQVLAESLV